MYATTTIMPNKEEEAGPVSDHSLFKDLKLLLAGSVWIYGVTQLRELARKGKLGDAQLEKDILSDEYGEKDPYLFDAFQANRQAIIKNFGEKGTETYLGCIEDVQKELNFEQGGTPPFTRGVIDDEHNESGCVYAIGVDKQLKRVVVIFRGSVTPRDWLIDADSSMKHLPNPVESVERKHLNIHTGFYNYLYKKHHHQEKSTFDKIMSEATELLNENPGFRLWSTGHSLGAALSTLFAFSAATASNPIIPEPVVAVNFASPRVGNDVFRDAVEVLEKQRKLYLLRVANHRDPVTTMPNSGTAFCGVRLLKSRNYRHAGLELKLKKGGQTAFIHSTSRGYLPISTFFKDMGHNVRDASSCFVHGSPGLHFCATYLKRLNKASKKLESLKLSHLWNDSHKREINLKESNCR